jgi:L-amino acid N-acyltransferase YncA
MKTSPARPALTLRQFTDADYERLVEIANGAYDDYAWTVAEIRHWDSGWDDPKYFMRRIVAEDADSRVVGYGEASHSRHTYHPDRYHVDVTVEAPARRRGVGGQLYDALIEELTARDASALRAQIKETMTDGVEFARRRGFAETKRDWESRLDVAAFDFARFADAPGRVARHGITIATMADEMARDPGAQRRAFEMHEEVGRDVPTIDPHSPSTFESYVRDTFESPGAAPDAYFVAIRGGRYVGESYMERSVAQPDVMYQGLTGVIREERGTGVAIALKLRTVQWALANGIREIRTWNDTLNRPMLRINEAMGFVKQPAWIRLTKELRPEA